LREIEPELAKKGAAIVPIGNGGASFIRGFREKTGLAGPVYTDPSRKTFEAAALVRTVRNFLHPASLVASVRAAAKGFLPGTQVKGDALQLGGVLVVRPGGRVAFHYASRHVGDHPSNEEILAAVG
jgi:hypothetical protein